jgi:cytochrome c-type biogenesis protein
MSMQAFAFGAGMLATVSPCGFAMLPAFLGYFLSDDTDASESERPLAARLANGLSVGVFLSLGFAGLFVVVGLVVALGLRSLVTVVPWLAVIIGVVLTVLGALMLAGRDINVRIGRGSSTRKGRTRRRMVAFGAAYAVTSLSCTLAVLLSVIAQASATANALELLSVFLAYGLGAATVLVALAIAAALASAALTRVVRRILPYVSRISGAMLGLSGIYLLAYWLPTVSGRDADSSTFLGFGGRLSSMTTTLLNRYQAVADISVLIVVATLTTTITVQKRRQRLTAAERDSKSSASCD